MGIEGWLPNSLFMQIQTHPMELSMVLFFAYTILGLSHPAGEVV